MNMDRIREYFILLGQMGQFLQHCVARAGATFAFVFAFGLVTQGVALVGPARESPEFAPYVVMVLDSSSGRDNASFCTASVISQNVVLTAAHCAAGLADTQVFFRDSEGELVFYPVDSIAINPGYRPNVGRQHIVSVDLALIRLTKPLPESFKPVDLAGTFQAKPGKPLRIIGFGLADERRRGTSGVLRSGVLATSGPKSDTLLWLIDPDGTGLGGCTGDSGGPIFSDSQPLLVAVAIKAKGSNGYFCGAMTEALLIGPQVPWIDKTLQGWGIKGSAAK